MFDVLGISGSPRKGNTEILVKRALDICKNKKLSTEFISLADKKIYPFGIDIKDDSEEVLNLMTKARAIIVGSPTYFANISSNLKALFEKSIQLRRNNMQLRNKIGGAIAVGATRNGGQEFTILAIHNFMLLHEMIIVSDKDSAHFGGICIGTKPGDVLNDIEGLKTIDNLALKIVEILEFENKK